jgi:hypothetical protein
VRELVEDAREPSAGETTHLELVVRDPPLLPEQGETLGDPSAKGRGHGGVELRSHYATVTPFQKAT